MCPPTGAHSLAKQGFFTPSDLAWASWAMGSLSADHSLFEIRWVTSYGRIAALTTLLRDAGQRVVLTSGSFDILHEGHSMYLEAAREFGDFLVVGVDSDEKIRQRKGPGRPAVPEGERLRMVTHQRGVGAVVLKQPGDAKWDLIRAVTPDTLVATEETYTPIDIAILEKSLCERVEVLPRMAKTSTSERLRQVQFEFLRGATEEIRAKVLERLRANLDVIVGQAITEAMRDITLSGDGT